MSRRLSSSSSESTLGSSSRRMMAAVSLLSLLALMLLPSAASAPLGKRPLPVACPEALFNSSGYVSDLRLMAQLASGDARDAKGKCGTWRLVRTCESVYDTRMRIFQSERDPGMYTVSFRATQQTAAAEAIHQNRTMAPCRFLDGANCTGKVFNKFQQAFIKLVDTCWADVAKLENRTVLVTGHSLGGAFLLFMAVKLWQDLNTLPAMVIGWAGPFIGDKAFTDAYLQKLQPLMQGRWWQVETVKLTAPKAIDPTCTEYDPMVFVQNKTNNAVCGLFIQREVNTSYGMHDLDNYGSMLNGTAAGCVLPV